MICISEGPLQKVKALLFPFWLTLVASRKEIELYSFQNESANLQAIYFAAALRDTQTYPSTTGHLCWINLLSQPKDMTLWMQYNLQSSDNKLSTKSVCFGM